MGDVQWQIAVYGLLFTFFLQLRGQLSFRNSYFYRFLCHHPLITQLRWSYWYSTTISKFNDLSKWHDPHISHLHVPRFHHAGDSDAEDAPGDPDGVIHDIDESDPENEDHLETVRRRNYNLLIKRREERRGRRSRSKKNSDQEEVEDILLEQVEREREDKLCVICQDREKCIMILPCRQ